MFSCMIFNATVLMFLKKGDLVRRVHLDYYSRHVLSPSEYFNKVVHCCVDLVTTDDFIAKYLKEGDARRALHELHDGMDAYSDILLYHLTR